MGIIPTIPVIFEINTLCGLLITSLNHIFFLISLQFLRGFQATSNPRKIVTGYPMQHRDFLYFFIGENLQCTLWIVMVPGT